jgi:thiamine-phosphate diphosphorylase
VLPRLHAVTDDEILRLADVETRALSLTQAGNVALHLRGRETTGRRLIRFASQFVADGAVVIVNDRVDLVPYVGAHGIHLPAEGLSVASARAALGSSVYVGRSTHTPEEARAAWDAGADYVFLGPIWETASHPGRPAIGPAAIEAAWPARVIAIGGITPHRVDQCLTAGAFGVAALSAVWKAPDPGAAARRMLVSLLDV